MTFRKSEINEVEIGSFKNAIDPQTKTFRDFPNWAGKI